MADVVDLSRAAIALGIAAGVALMVVGLALLRRPRSPLRLPLAGFAILYGLYLLAFRLGPEPEGLGWLGKEAIVTGQLASGAGGLGLLGVASAWHDLRSERHFAAWGACFVAVGVAFLNFWFSYAYFMPELTPTAVLGPPVEAALQLFAGFGAFCALLLITWLTLAAWRAPDHARRVAPLVWALLPAEGLFYGWYLVGDVDAGALVVLADALMVVLLFVLGAAWFRLHAGGLGGGRSFLGLGLAFFLFPCLGAWTALPDGPWAQTLSDTSVALAAAATAAILAVASRRPGFLDALPGEHAPPGPADDPSGAPPTPKA